LSDVLNTDTRHLKPETTGIKDQKQKHRSNISYQEVNTRFDMVDVLLIQPPIRDFYLTAKRTIPYGLSCLAASLMENGFSVRIFDALATPKSRVIDVPPGLAYVKEFFAGPDRSPFALFHHYRHYGYSFDHIGKIARDSGAFLVGISSLFTPYSAEALRTAEIVKASLPSCKIVLGGHHPTAMPESVLESAAVDFVIRGDGEASLAKLARAVKNNDSFTDIPGLVFKQTNQEQDMPHPAVIKSLDSPPLPAYDLIQHHYYKRASGATAVIMTSRGCPFKCSYCSMGASSHLPFRRRQIESVIAEIDMAVNTYEAGFIDFEDENLSMDREWFLSLLRHITDRYGDRQLELRAMNGLFPPALNAEVIAAMKTAGFKTLNLSLGTTSAAQLRRFQRPDVRQAFENALKFADLSGLDAVGYIIIAAPDQYAADSVADLLYLAQKRVLAGVSVFYPAPGSLDYERCKILKILPSNFACMRSSALPLSQTTTRLESVTLLRLGRILNFMKSVLDRGDKIPEPTPAREKLENPESRYNSGIQLLQHFRHDGKIRGSTPDGKVFEHTIAGHLTEQFLEGLQDIQLRGFLS
jgi:radical SAM superfamily enzyme YgiQ (UPF0313 family)